MSNIDYLYKLIKENEVVFLSLKYLDTLGNLKHVDVLVNELVVSDGIILVNNLRLRPIVNMAFIDPFRSCSTILCLCDNLIAEFLPRIILRDISIDANMIDVLELQIILNFFIYDLESNEAFCDYQNYRVNYKYIIEPEDKLSNLRAEILDVLNKLSVPTVSHFHGRNNSSCSIVIKSKSFLNLCDYFMLAVYVINNVAISYGKRAFFSLDLNNEILLFIKNSQCDRNDIIFFIKKIISGSKSEKIFAKRFNATFYGDNIESYHYEDDLFRMCHIINFGLNYNVNIYITILYLLIYGFDVNKISKKSFQEILRIFYE